MLYGWRYGTRLDGSRLQFDCTICIEILLFVNWKDSSTIFKGIRMKLSNSQLYTLLAITFSVVSMLVPASMGEYGERLRASWLWGLYWDSKNGVEFGYAESYLAYLTPSFIVTVALGIGHLVHSLASKTADKWLNQCAGGVLVFFTAFAYFIGIYIGAGMWIYTSVPIGLPMATLAGLFGLWAANLTRQEKNLERQTPKEGM
jgi:hypothetical protein